MPQGWRGWGIFAVRWLLPAVIFLVGLVVIVAGGGDSTAIEGGFMVWGVALAVLVVNLLVRIGNEGDVSRDREEEARRYLDEHGHWPDEDPRSPR